MKSDTWYDLSAHGVELITMRVPSGRLYVMLRPSVPGTDMSAALAKPLAFEPAPGNPALLIRNVRQSQDGTIQWPFTRSDLLKAFPEAKDATFDPGTHYRDQTARQAAPRASAGPGTPGPFVPGSGRPLGTNALGHAVFENTDGSRHAVDDRNRAYHEAGTPDDQRGNFLRATDADGRLDVAALQKCAQGFVEAAVRGRSQGSADLDALSETAGVAPPDKGRLLAAIGAAAAAHVSKKGGKTLREAFITGFNLSDKLRPLRALPGATPLPMAAAAQRLLGLVAGTAPLRITVSGAGAGEFLTHLPRDADVRLPDASSDAAGVAAGIGLRVATGGDAASDRLVLNLPARENGTAGTEVAGIEAALAARSDDGIAVIVMDAPEGTEDAVAVDAMRERLAIAYEFEGEAAVGAGLTGGPRRLMMAVGPRRPAPDGGALPPVAWPVEDWSSLWTWTAEVVSERSKAAAVAPAERATLREGGRTDSAHNPFQVPYVSASKVGKPKSMVPRNLEGATRDALAQAVQAGGGDADAWVAREFGYDVADLGRLFSPEQVDALALYLHAEARGRGFLEADQTGIGKGRVLAAILRRTVMKGDKALFLTERQVNLSDIWRDIIHIESTELFRPLVVNDGVQIIDERTNSVVFGSAPREQVDAMLDAREWPEGVNLVMGTYSQFSRDAGTAATPGGDAALSTRKARWLQAAVDPSVRIVADECHNASSLTSNTSANAVAAVKAAHPCTVYSSATFAKDAEHMSFYAPLFPDGISTSELEGMMRAGGEAFQEVLSSMLVHDGVMVRREFDLSRVTYHTLVDTPRFDRNREYMDAVAPVLAELVKLSGDVDALIRRQNAGGDEAAQATAQREANARKVKPFHLTRTGFGSPLYNISRLFVAALKTDAAVEDALQALQENKKPVIMVENTVQSLLEELAGTAASLEGSLVPDFRALFHRTVRQMTTARWTDQDKIQHLRDMTESSPELKARAERVAALIDAMPILPVSAIDEVKRRIREAGWSVDEITGRDIEVRDGRVMRRPASNPTAVKNAFNAGDIDALVINVAGSTGIDLHASGRFGDRRKRRLIELQAPADILRKMQSHGRVNRYDQVEDPEIVNIVSGLPIELRLIAMENAKVRRMSANTTSNRDAAILTRDIPDLINPIGDMVCARYAEARPDLMRRLGFRVEEIVDASNENIEQEEAVERTMREAMVAHRKSGPPESKAEREVREALERKAREGSSKVRDSKRTANEILARVIMLPTSLQEQVCRELTAEFNAAVEELEAAGETPLRASDLQGTVHERERRVFDGAETSGTGSVFHEPLYILEGAVKRLGKPLRVDDLMDRIQIGNMASGRARSCIDRLKTGTEEILRPFLPEGCLTVADALTRGVKDVALRKERLDALAEAVELVRPGKQVGYRVDGNYVDGIVTRVEYPDRGYEHVHGGYGVEFVIPGDEKPRSMRLSTLMRDPDFKVKDGLEGREYDAILKSFEDAQHTRLSQVQILTHNVYRAVKLNWEHRLGKLQTFVGEDGTRHRGVVLTRRGQGLNSVPVELHDAGMAWEAIDARGVQATGSATLSDKTLSIQPVDRGTRFEIRLPRKTVRQHSHLYDHELVAAVYRRHVPDGKSAPKLVLDRAEAKALVEALYDAGARFWTTPFERKWATEYRAANPRQAARTRDGVEDEPRPMGMVA